MTAKHVHRIATKAPEHKNPRRRNGSHRRIFEKTATAKEQKSNKRPEMRSVPLASATIMLAPLGEDTSAMSRQSSMLAALG